MNEQLSAREIEQRFTADARRMDGIESRLTGLAKDAVMANVWSLENGHVRDLIANVETRSRERHAEVLERHTEVLAAIDEVRKGINRRSEWTWSRTLSVAGIVAVIIAAWITAVLTSKGIH